MFVRVNVVLNRTVVVDSDNNNSPIQDYVHPDDQTQPFVVIIVIIIFNCYYLLISFYLFCFRYYTNINIKRNDTSTNNSRYSTTVYKYNTNAIRRIIFQLS